MKNAIKLQSEQVYLSYLYLYLVLEEIHAPPPTLVCLYAIILSSPSSHLTKKQPSKMIQFYALWKKSFNRKNKCLVKMMRNTNLDGIHDLELPWQVWVISPPFMIITDAPVTCFRVASAAVNV